CDKCDLLHSGCLLWTQNTPLYLLKQVTTVFISKTCRRWYTRLVPTLVHPLLQAMPDGRRALLDAMKKRGELPVEALAEAVGVTISGARQHLSGLERDGL